MKRISWTLGVVGMSGLLGGACSTGSQAKTPENQASPSAVHVGSTLVDCGPGQRLLLEQVSGVTRVQCVAGDTSARAPLAVPDQLQAIPVDAQVPAGLYGAAPRPVSYEPRPSVRPATRTVVARGRSWKKSAAIIGGSTAAGAGVGAILDGGGGAKKGAVVGLVGGVVYDIATRDR